jgi:uncharacterized protein YbaP (TraB family)
MLQIMKEYGWDYHTYNNQPAWVLDLAVKKFGLEAKLAEQQNQTHA